MSQRYKHTIKYWDKEGENCTEEVINKEPVLTDDFIMDHLSLPVAQDIISVETEPVMEDE